MPLGETHIDSVKDRQEVIKQGMIAEGILTLILLVDLIFKVANHRQILSLKKIQKTKS